MGRSVKKGEKICGVVTLYYPPKDYYQSIRSYIDYVDILYVIDNSPKEFWKDSEFLLQKYDKVVILSRGENIGIARALNIALKRAWSSDADWLLTMDQDSKFEKNQAIRYFDSLKVVDTEQVAILSPQHKKSIDDSGKCRYEEKTVVWTSGNLLNLKLVRQVGLFDERLFIDSVDHEYCFRIQKAGYKVLQAINCHIEHTLGEKVEGHMFWGLKRKKVDIHSPKRLYFIIRNALYLIEWYGVDYPDFLKKLSKQTKKEFVRALKYSNSRKDYMRYAWRAYLDYRKHIYGNPVDI